MSRTGTSRNISPMADAVADEGFTGGAVGFSIVTVRSWTEQLLTKRRAVDFCRVATALCC